MAYGFHQLVNKFASADEKLVASNFIGFMFSDPSRWWDATGQLQPRKDWYTSPEMQASVGLDVFIKDLADARGLPQTSDYLAIQTAIKNAIQRVVFEGADMQASLDAGPTGVRHRHAVTGETGRACLSASHRTACEAACGAAAQRRARLSSILQTRASRR